MRIDFALRADNGVQTAPASDQRGCDLGAAMADPTYILTNTPIADRYLGASVVKTAERISPTLRHSNRARARIHSAWPRIGDLRLSRQGKHRSEDGKFIFTRRKGSGSLLDYCRDYLFDIRAISRMPLQKGLVR